MRSRDMSEENDTLPSMETYTSAGTKDMSILQLQLELIGRQRSIMLRKQAQIQEERAHLQEKVRRELMSTVRQIRLELVEGRLGLDWDHDRLDRDLDLAALAYPDLDEVEWDFVDQEWNVLGLEPDLFNQDMSGVLPQNQERPISVLPTLTCVDRPSS